MQLQPRRRRPSAAAAGWTRRAVAPQPNMAPTPSVNALGQPLLIFEAELDYRANSLRGYWGPVSSSIDWCERNYVVTPYIAEFYNTCSNLAMVLLGLLGMYLASREGHEKRYIVTSFTLFAIGCGSAAFHGTLTHIGQQGDETPMVVGSAVWLWCLAFSDPAFEARNPALARRAAWACGALTALFAVAHYTFAFVAVFQGLIAVMATVMVATLSVRWRRSPDRSLTPPYCAYMLSILTALPLWLLDQHACAHLHALRGGVPNPQFHAWWHILMGANCYLAPVVEGSMRLAARGQKPRVRYCLGLIPYVQRGNPRST